MWTCHSKYINYLLLWHVGNCLERASALQQLSPGRKSTLKLEEYTFGKVSEERLHLISTLKEQGFKERIWELGWGRFQGSGQNSQKLRGLAGREGPA